MKSLKVSLLLTAFAAALSHCHAVIDEETQLDRESQPAELDADDTSLLQTAIHMPMSKIEPLPPAAPSALGLHITASEWNPRGIAFFNLPAVPGDMVDVPEAEYAWALFQHVPPGPVQLPLANDTELEPPGAGLINAALLKFVGVGVNRPSYKAALNGNYVPFMPSWFWDCVKATPDEYYLTNISSQLLFATAVPQIVPFIVPMDHPNRSDVSVVITPGGGGVFLAWESEGTDVAKWLNLLGISAFLVKYRVPAPDVWPLSAAVLDVQRAISMVRHLAPQLGLNSSRVGLFGSSHGGWVSLMAAFSARRQYEARDSVDEHSPMPDFLILLYPEIDEELMRRGASPEPVGMVGGLAVTDLRNPPPMFIAHGANDGCCQPEKLYAFHTMLKQHSDPTVEINIYDNIGHGFSMCYRQENGGMEAMQHEACMWMLRARRFIMWHAEQRAPVDVEAWYGRMRKFETALLATNTSGMHPKTS